MHNRVFVVSFRASAPEREALLCLARHEGRKPSETMRELLRREVARRGMWPAHTGRPETTEGVGAS